MKTQLYSYVLCFHVFCGFTALSIGLAIILIKKGTPNHIKAGMIYFWSMSGIFVTTLLLLCIAPEKGHLWFLAGVSIFSFYQTYSGRRMVQQKGRQIEANQTDWFALAVLLISSVWSFFKSVQCILEGESFRAGLFLFFAFLGSTLVLKDFRIFTKKVSQEKLHWFYQHISRMMGSYAATTTAFLVNVVPKHLPETTPGLVFLSLWVAPGVLIGYFTSSYVNSLKNGRNRKVLSSE